MCHLLKRLSRVGVVVLENQSLKGLLQVGVTLVPKCAGLQVERDSAICERSKFIAIRLLKLLRRLRRLGRLATRRRPALSSLRPALRYSQAGASAAA